MKILLLSLLIISPNVFSHSGRTNSSGCHHDHKNGGYHCHNSEDLTKDRKPASDASEKNEESNHDKEKKKSQIIDQ